MEPQDFRAQVAQKSQSQCCFPSVLGGVDDSFGGNFDEGTLFHTMNLGGCERWPKRIGTPQNSLFVFFEKVQVSVREFLVLLVTENS